MPYLILIPPAGEVRKYHVHPGQMISFVLNHIALPERGMMAHDIYGIGAGNCFCDDSPMNQYIPGMAGTVIVDNDGKGFMEKAADEFVAEIQSARMTPEEAETHRPPKIEHRIIGDTAHIYVFGNSTEHGMRSVHGFINQIKAMVDSVPGKSLEVHTVEKDFVVPEEPE